MVEEQAHAAAKTPPKKGGAAKAVIEWAAVIAVAALIIWALFVHTGPWPWESTPVQPAPPAPLPADVELYRFSDPKTNNTVNVEIWLKNTGEQRASNVNVFVRVRNQNGTILYSAEPSLTWMVLGENETCSTTYSVRYDRNDTYMDHTVEVRWAAGMNSYLEKTDLR